MEATTNVFGHPAHHGLAGFPLGLLATSSAFDIAFLVIAHATFPAVAF
jgi:uncharacterized membrane protein